MPRYHFHVANSDAFPDEIGTELPNLEAAKSGAVRYAGELIRDMPLSFWSGEEWSMRVTDDRDLTLFTLDFVATVGPVAHPR